ncbi:MAG: hypothetical protein Q8K32_19810 [Archangium sp.]|nr:hypothetical protein [Archangium sp.]
MKTTRTFLVSTCVLLCGCVGEVVEVRELMPPAEISTRAPAVLTLTTSASPAMISVGQQLLLEVTVHNGGETTASAVVPRTPVQTGSGLAAIDSSPNPVDIEGGQSHVFTFVYTATDPGSISFEVGADGVDMEHDRSVTAMPATTSVIVQSAAMLTVEALTTPTHVVLGAEFTVTMTVLNGGQSPATAVTPDLLTSRGEGAATLVSGPTPAFTDVPRGGAVTFAWTFRATQLGRLTFTGGASGLDGNSNAPVLAEPVSSPAITLDTPAQLEALFSVPAHLTVGQPFTATLVVKNSGSALAKNVLPNPPATTGGAATTTTVATPVDLPGGATAVFTWSYTATGTGNLSLATVASGVDQAQGLTIHSNPATSNTATVQAPSALVVTALTVPSLITRGQTFDVTLVVKNTGTTAANNVVPNPNPATLTVTGGAGATTSSQPAAQNLAAGASATFTWAYTENGAAAGTLAFTGGARNGTLTSSLSASNLAVVVPAPTLLIESITLPPKVSRGQAFDATVVVRNTGGAAASGVAPSVSLTVTGGVQASTSAAAPVTIGGGGRATFVFPMTERGTGPGTLRVQATASGTGGATGEVLSSVPLQSLTTTVESAAQLSITAFTIPAAVDRGGGFTLSMTVNNEGQAAAMNVTPIPAPPSAMLTGGVRVATTSVPTPVTIPGNSSQTFTWTYAESGTAAGTLAFSGGVQGLDANSGQALVVPARLSNAAPVATPTGCNGSLLYAGFGGRSLDGDRLDRLVGTDRLRVKPYPMLVTDYNRVLGSTPSAIQNQAQTFNQPPGRWAEEQELSAVSLYQSFQASFQGCLGFTNAGTAYAANPTAATANTECANFQRRFWSRVPSAAETAACVSFATSAVNNDTNPRRRWAYACAAVLTSTGFLAQ